MKIKNKFRKTLVSLVIAGCLSLGSKAEASIFTKSLYDYIKDAVNSRRHEESYQEVIQLISSPDEARDFMSHNFSYKSDKENYGRDDFWSSFRNSYEKGGGDCEDYAIAYASLLSDDAYPPVILVMEGKKKGHTVFVYQENNLYGSIGVGSSDWTEPKFKSINELVRSLGDYHIFSLVNLNNFGKDGDFIDTVEDMSRDSLCSMRTRRNVNEGKFTPDLTYALSRTARKNVSQPITVVQAPKPQNLEEKVLVFSQNLNHAAQDEFVGTTAEEELIPLKERKGAFRYPVDDYVSILFGCDYQSVRQRGSQSTLLSFESAYVYLVDKASAQWELKKSIYSANPCPFVASHLDERVKEQNKQEQIQRAMRAVENKQRVKDRNYTIKVTPVNVSLMPSQRNNNQLKLESISLNVEVYVSGNTSFASTIPQPQNRTRRTGNALGAVYHETPRETSRQNPTPNYEQVRQEKLDYFNNEYQKILRKAEKDPEEASKLISKLKGEIQEARRVGIR